MDRSHATKAVSTIKGETLHSLELRKRKQDDHQTQNGSHKTLSELIRSRHSTRSFTDRVIPRSILDEVFELAHLAPSSLNVQPWQLSVVSGAHLEGLKASMHRAFDEKLPMSLPPNLEDFARYRSLFEEQLYFSPEGFNIPRGDTALYTQTLKQNFDFYNAPTVFIVTISKMLSPADVLSVGIYLQTLVLLLSDKGIQGCFQGSVTLWPDLVRKELGLTNDAQLLCSLAVGYEDSEEHINLFRIPKVNWTENVNFLGE